MMKSEFIELTGFEPTAEEYNLIEAEYMGCDVDKQKFCKDWLKNNGIQRMCRHRATRISILEGELATQQKLMDDQKNHYTDQIACMQNTIAKLMDELSDVKADLANVREQRDSINMRLASSTRNLRHIKEAFDIINNLDI